MSIADPTREQFPAPATSAPQPDVLDDADMIEDDGPRRGRAGTVLSWVLLAAMGAAFIAFLVAVYVPTRTQHRAALADLDQRTAELEQAVTERDASRADEEAVKRQVGAAEEKTTELSTRVTELEQERDALAQDVAKRDAALKLLVAAKKKLEASLGDEIKSGDVSVLSRGGELVLGVADRVLFAIGHAELNDRGKKVLKRVADTIRDNPDRVFQVAGHTDDDAVTGELAAIYPTNWELSAARATNVVRFLQEQCEVPGDQLIAAGFADKRPVASNKSAKSKRKNRRIEITMLAQPRPKTK